MSKIEQSSTTSCKHDDILLHNVDTPFSLLPMVFLTFLYLWQVERLAKELARPIAKPVADCTPAVIEEYLLETERPQVPCR